MASPQPSDHGAASLAVLTSAYLGAHFLAPTTNPDFVLISQPANGLPTEGTSPSRAAMTLADAMLDAERRKRSAGP